MLSELQMTENADEQSTAVYFPLMIYYIKTFTTNACMMPYYEGG